MSIFKKQKQFPQIYVKEWPFHLNEIAKKRIRTLGEFLGIILLTAFIAYILLNNFAPFGITTHYSLAEDNNNISEPGPTTRVKKEIINNDVTFHQFQDIIYFNTEMPFLFDRATVRITFKNSDPKQNMSLGYQDQEVWHYNTKPLDVPFINNLSWTTTGTNPTLYEKEKNFASVNDFLANPPKELLIGTYNYETSLGQSIDPSLLDYAPSADETVIDVPLRGRHTLFAYLKNEPFIMTIQKQDLNWYEDPDTMTVNVYKDKDLVFQITADDDGIADASKKVMYPQEITIKNPGPELPENGVYRIVIDANNDTLIKEIRTNLHKMVFANSIFPAASISSYPSIITSASATTVYTNALFLSAVTYHNAGLQEIRVGSKTLDLNTVKINKSITPEDIITKIEIPKNDVILNGFQGYFAFSEDQFFLPTPYRIVPISKKEDLELVDYLLTTYHPSTPLGDYRTNEISFDLSTAVIKNGRLSWMIAAPGLKESNKEILIKNIDITFHKKPWL